MTNPFKWYVYVSIDDGPWQRYRELSNSERGRQAAVNEADRLTWMVGMEACVSRERREGGK